MLKNYFKITLRNLIKNKTHTLINIGGLTLGVVSALIIFLVIQFDLSFDNWHEDRDRIYRVVTKDTNYGRISYSGGGPYPRSAAIRNDVVGVEHVSIVNTNFANSAVVSYAEDGVTQKRFKEEDIAFVDQEYFDIFTYRWIAGNSSTALERPNTMVVSESFAKKMFGTTEVVGKILHLNIGFLADFEITGVIKDAPENSDFPFNLLVASHSQDRNGNTFENDSWSSSSNQMQTYLKLKPGITPREIDAQFDPLIVKYQSEEHAEVLDFFLQPLSEIHFDSRFGNYGGRVIEKNILFALGIIGLFLLITACINFINLNTAIAVNRSKEVGLRKTLGGTKIELLLHFLGETALVTFIAIAIGLGITEILVQYMEPLLGFTIDLSLFSNPALILLLCSLMIGITLAAGWYPAQHLSGLKPIEAIRNKVKANYGQGLTLRRGLIVLQFTITQILIIGTIVIAGQIRYFQSQDLGYTKEAIVEVDLPSHDKQTLDTFKNMLRNEPSIQNVTFSNTGTTSNSTWSGNYLLIDDSIRYEDNAQVKFIDEDFVDTYGLTILAGRNLLPSDTTRGYLVNEAFARQVGYGDDYQGLLGKPNIFWGSEAPIVGVVKDFNTQSLHSELDPVILTTRRTYYMGAVKINAHQTSAALTTIERAYAQAFPDFIFEYSFLDESIAEMYDYEKRIARIMHAFTLIAILIGCLGLFGLVSYMAATRTKEIGVRKVLGASIASIVKIFASELTLLTGIAFLFAAPVSWYLMQQWLQDFAYKIDIGIGIFAAALFGTILIAVLTVGYKSIQAALMNPVESLKNE